MRTPLITVWRVLQYPVGLTSAALVSVLAAATLLWVGVSLPLMHSLVGFLGVFLGTLLFMPMSRRAGAVFLASIGIVFYYVQFVWYQDRYYHIPDRWFQLGFISAGAIVAVVIHVAWCSLSETKRASR